MYTSTYNDKTWEAYRMRCMWIPNKGDRVRQNSNHG